MTYKEFEKELKLENKVIGITRKKLDIEAERIPGACGLAVLNHVLQGETVVLTAERMACRGSAVGFGFSDDLPDMPGGVGHFISYGRGKGFPAGECIKRTPQLGEELFKNQPAQVMGRENNAIELRPYLPGDSPDTVTVLVTPDQLSALAHLFNYDEPVYDNIIVPMVSGCASVFRIPFGELKRGKKARAVVGNVDVFSRPHFPGDTFFFTFSGTAFENMITIAGESILCAPIWKGVKKRL